ncbi:MAG: hypothetical protein JSV01_06870 [Desulfobacterales bacterium]|nr:MAG: hypothetical protein JSV01_06870 [Desulfobacterales bacterium]
MQKALVYCRVSTEEQAERGYSLDAQEKLCQSFAISSGYKVAGVSPFGMKQRLRVMIDAGLLACDKVAINGGKRGLMLIMSPADILKATNAEPIEL